MNIEQIRTAAEAESGGLNDPSCIRILVASSSTDSSADALLDSFHDAIRKGGLCARVFRAGSFGYCGLEPIVVITLPNLSTVVYRNVTPDDAPHLIADCAAKKLRRRDKVLCRKGGNEARDIPHIDELPLFKLQNRIALRNCGWIDPESIHHYIVSGRGYTGLSRALKMGKEELLHSITGSVRSGRYGAGGSTADAWELCSESEEENRYLICSAIDTDPKGRTARLLLESDPHSVLEGMLICAFALSAPRCFIFIRENSGAVRRVKKALEQMRGYSLLGANILDSSFSSQIEIREVPALSSSGYMTEWFRCIEEKQPAPHVHPGCSAPGEFELNPAVIAGPEAMSCLSADPAAAIESSMESKVVTLSGSVKRKYTVEVNLEMTVRRIVEELGGGASNAKAIKAAKLGGPAGVFAVPELFDRPLGRMVGEESNSNFSLDTIEVFDSEACMVDAAKDAMEYIQAQSCGKCSLCREGSLQMLAVLEDIAENRGKPRDLELLTDLGREMKRGCLCAFGRTAPNPVLSSIEHFRGEYVKRINESG